MAICLSALLYMFIQQCCTSNRRGLECGDGIANEGLWLNHEQTVESANYGLAQLNGMTFDLGKAFLLQVCI